jgi:hypothetical protein
MNRRFGITALLAIVAQACGVGAETAWQGTITDSAGVAIVENPALGMWTPEQAWTVTEALRIGTAEGEPEYQFGALTGLAVAGDGRIVVLDGQGRHLKVFAPHGKYERTIGGPGGGPGEIGAAGAQIVMAPGDTLVVSDFGNQRVSLYLVDGTFVRSFPQNFADGMAFRWEVADDGRIVAQLRRFAFPGSTAPPDTMDAIVVRRLDGSTGDTLMRVPSHPVWRERQIPDRRVRARRETRAGDRQAVHAPACDRRRSDHHQEGVREDLPRPGRAATAGGAAHEQRALRIALPRLRPGRHGGGA